MTKRTLFFFFLLVIGFAQVFAQEEEIEDLEYEPNEPGSGFDNSGMGIYDDITSDDEDLISDGSGEDGPNVFITDDEDDEGFKTLNTDDIDIRVTPSDKSVKPENPSVQATDPNQSQSILKNSAFMAAIIIGGSLGLLLACCVFLLVVYRLRKKDQGSYPIDDKKPSSGGYQYTQGQEYYA